MNYSLSPSLPWKKTPFIRRRTQLLEQYAWSGLKAIPRTRIHTKLPVYFFIFFVFFLFLFLFYFLLSSVLHLHRLCIVGDIYNPWEQDLLEHHYFNWVYIALAKRMRKHRTGAHRTTRTWWMTSTTTRLPTTTLGNLFDITPMKRISKVYFEDKLIETWNHERTVLIGDVKVWLCLPCTCFLLLRYIWLRN